MYTSPSSPRTSTALPGFAMTFANTPSFSIPLPLGAERLAGPTASGSSADVASRAYGERGHSAPTARRKTDGREVRGRGRVGVKDGMSPFELP